MADNESATEVIASSSGAAGATASASVAGVTLPGAVRERVNGQLDGHTIVAWAEFDLDEHNRFARQFAVLTETALFVLPAGDGQSTRSIPLRTIGESKINEGLGVDRLTLTGDEKLIAE